MISEMLDIVWLAHGGSHHSGHAQAGGIEGSWWWAWSMDWRATLGIMVASLVYVTGLTRLWRRAGRGRGVSIHQAAFFGMGIVALVTSLISPVDTISDQLLWVHMIQHMLLMLIAAPLIVAGSPGVVAAWVLPGRWRRRLAHAMVRMRLTQVSRHLLWQPVLLWGVFALVLWVWHLPVLFEAALEHPLIHDLQHLAFFVSAALYWRVVFDPVGRVRLTPALVVAYLFTTSLHGMLLGVFMALSPGAWYPFYNETTQAWGLSSLEDQQVAGFIMWMPACAVYAIVAVAVLGVWLHRSNQADLARASWAVVPSADHAESGDGRP